MIYILYIFLVLIKVDLGRANLYILNCFYVISKRARSVNLEYSSRFNL
jgi:hypothetical protein